MWNLNLSKRRFQSSQEDAVPKVDIAPIAQDIQSTMEYLPKI